MKFFDRPMVWPAILLGVALIIGLWIVGWGISARGQDNSISSTGSASQNVKADTAKWSIDIRRTAYESGIAYATSQVSRDGKAVADFLQSQNLASSSVSSSIVYTEQNYRYDQSSAPTTYNVHQQITIQTTDVEKIDALSKNIGEVNSRVTTGAIVAPQAPEFYVSNLPELRIALIGKAVADAKARATQIAKSGGSSVGSLRSASSGVVQVLAPNATNVEDYGTYDTSTIQKVVMVTARATFSVR